MPPLPTRAAAAATLDRMNRISLPAVPAVAAAALVPWTIGLATLLPRTATARHWNIVWAGLDVAIIAGLASTSWLARRRDRRVTPAAVATATLMCADAWFDVCTSDAGLPFATACASAAVEVAVAATCLVVARAADPAERLPARRTA
jgi:hypothetical protein